MSANVNTDTSEFTIEELKFSWIISNWLNLKRDENQISKETYSISTDQPILSKWKIGLLKSPFKDEKVIFNLTLLELENNMNMVQASFKFSVIDSGSNRKSYISKTNKFTKVNEVNLLTDGHGIPISENWRPGYILDNHGRLHIKVKLTLVLPYPPTKTNLAEATLRTETLANYRRNQLALLNDSASSDIKIVTSDNVEIMAHKFVLQVQCPVFASMFRSQFTESREGTIKIKDLCGKVIYILLHLFYTGELRDSWSDPDVIIEFTYAAGKYQLVEILNMLDNVLGDHDNGGDCQNDVLLLNMVNKLCLKNAEKKLLDRIRNYVVKCKTAVGLFMIFGVKVNEDMLGNEEIGTIMEIWEETLGEPNNEEPRNVGRRDILLLNYAGNKRLKKLESSILKRIIFAIKTFETADKLFALFENLSKA